MPLRRINNSRSTSKSAIARPRMSVGDRIGELQVEEPLIYFFCSLVTLKKTVFIRYFDR